MTSLELEVLKTKIEYFKDKKIITMSEDEINEFMEFRNELPNECRKVINYVMELVKSFPEDVLKELVEEIR